MTSFPGDFCDKCTPPRSLHKAVKPHCVQFCRTVGSCVSPVIRGLDHSASLSASCRGESCCYSSVDYYRVRLLSPLDTIRQPLITGSHINTHKQLQSRLFPVHRSQCVRSTLPSVQAFPPRPWYQAHAHHHHHFTQIHTPHYTLSSFPTYSVLFERRHHFYLTLTFTVYTCNNPHMFIKPWQVSKFMSDLAKTAANGR